MLILYSYLIKCIYVNKLTDKEILKNIKEKDEKTIYYLRMEYLPLVKYMVLNYVYSNGKITTSGSQSDVEDILHDALYIVIKKILSDNFILTSKLSTYFYAVSKNLLKVKLHRKLFELEYKKFNKDYIFNPGKTDILYDKNLKKKAFDYYFEQLSNGCQEMLNLYWLEYSVTDISNKLGFTKNYVMKRKYECKNKLVDLIKKNPDNL